MASPLPRSGAGLRQVFPDFDGEEPETKTICPACTGMKVRCCAFCKGCGKKELEPAGPRLYRWVACDSCKGEGAFPCNLCQGQGMVTASRASGFRKRLAGYG